MIVYPSTQQGDPTMSTTTPTPTLDRILTVAIGDRDRNGQTMALAAWTRLRADVRRLLSSNTTVVASTAGVATTSDQRRAMAEASVVFVCVLHDATHLGYLRKTIASYLRAANASSACFAIDSAHEPVFDTPTGARPAPTSTPTAATYRPTHQGYPG